VAALLLLLLLLRRDDDATRQLIVARSSTRDLPLCRAALLPCQSTIIDIRPLTMIPDSRRTSSWVLWSTKVKKQRYLPFPPKCSDRMPQRRSSSGAATRSLAYYCSPLLLLAPSTAARVPVRATSTVASFVRLVPLE